MPSGNKLERGFAFLENRHWHMNLKLEDEYLQYMQAVTGIYFIWEVAQLIYLFSLCYILHTTLRNRISLGETWKAKLLQECALSNWLTISKIEGLKKADWGSNGRQVLCHWASSVNWNVKVQGRDSLRKNVAESLHGQATWTDKWLYKGPLLNFTLLQCQKKPWDLEINVKAAFIVLCSVLKRKVTHFLLYFPVSRRGLNWVKWSQSHKRTFVVVYC